MGKNRNRMMLLSLLSAGIIGVSAYLMNSTLIEGSTPDETAASSTEEPKGEVTMTSVTSTDETSNESSAPVEQIPVVVEPEPEVENIPVDPANIYTVQSGETLWEISQTTGVSVQDLMITNQLSSAVIIEGQELVLSK
ncbi:LysM peptidoglycan-binding domain-containing protein [Enterococcus sp. BWT-B8]|uniref:LysM peptidoglycan-binding domain-containing protein n=1 Tax=unclassified Enterococcus TaxID=2608891 RepID=UPI001E5B32DF|nr:MULTISPECIES: LysM peptidoglycan-binding domain-containing protein [unclassified Enterococcus]MCB5952112.1 LysM peptidoglycan-binding domain-containing protein [Enterococcus sp. BWT-B8]MCB5954481.1 LysM peptidoglycan-binding domain-containing protein [Enterococcus sp. CWB-B31]